LLENIKEFFGIHAKLSRVTKIICGLLPFFLLVGGYVMLSNMRLKANPKDKLTPSISKMVQGVKQMAFTKDKRTGDYLMLKDTISSLRRLLIGLGLAAVVGLLLGLNAGALPWLNATTVPVIKFLSIIPPLAVLPILFITFGVGEVGKVVLIFLGSVFVITRDKCHEVQHIPVEEIVKAQTLGASQFQVVYRIILPQVMPRLLVMVRFCLGAAWVFLIASEAIASTDGLGYRIFLVRRYLAMYIIIPYVLWITFLGYTLDTMLRWFIEWKYSWYLDSRKKG